MNNRPDKDSYYHPDNIAKRNEEAARLEAAKKKKRDNYTPPAPKKEKPLTRKMRPPRQPNPLDEKFDKQFIEMQEKHLDLKPAIGWNEFDMNYAESTCDGYTIGLIYKNKPAFHATFETSNGCEIYASVHQLDHLTWSRDHKYHVQWMKYLVDGDCLGDPINWSHKEFDDMPEVLEYLNELI